MIREATLGPADEWKDIEMDEEQEKRCKQLETELFNNEQVRKITRQRYRNFMKYQYETEERSGLKPPRSKEQIKQQLRNEVRNDILKNNILEQDQLPEKFERQDSKDSVESKNRAMNEWKERSTNPRRNFRRANKGALNPGEIRVFDRLDRIGHCHRDSDGNLKNDIEVDSLLESVFGST